jgi:hypothetical protein
MHKDLRRPVRRRDRGAMVDGLNHRAMTIEGLWPTGMPVAIGKRDQP